jgi:hypothetical protein
MRPGGDIVSPYLLPLFYGRGSVTTATASTVVFVILPILVTILAAAAPGQAEQR